MEVDFKSKRHRHYKEYEDMYNNFENEWLEIRNFSTGNYLPVSLPREISQLYSDLAFGNPVSATLKDNPEANDALDDLIEDNELDVQLSEAALSQSYKGGVVALNYSDEGKSRISFIEVDYYFPTVSPTDKKKIISEVIAVPYEENKKKYLNVETYEKREDGYYWYTTQIFNYGNENLGSKITEPESVCTMLKESPLTYIPFSRSGTNFWGDSLYKGITPLFDELNHRITQISNILDVHSNPIMYATSSAFDDDGNLNRSGNGVYEVKEDNEGKINKPLGYVTWDWSSTANFKFIDEIVFKVLHYVSPLAPALYGMDEASQASGRAIQLKSWRSQSKITRSYQYWRTALKKILFTAQELQVISGEKSYTPEIPKIELHINAPIDLLENAQYEQLQIEMGTSSKRSSIARLNPHMDSKEVEEEYQAILEEQNEVNAKTFMGDMQGLSGFNTQPNTDKDNNQGDSDED